MDDGYYGIGMDFRNEDFVSGNVAETIVWSNHGVPTILDIINNGASRSTKLIVANILRSSEGYVA